MKIKGIKQGKTIELLEEINIPDGSEVLIEIQEIQKISDEERRKRLYELLENWEGREEFLELLTELDRKRNTSADVKANRSKLIEVAISGEEEVVITRDNLPVVKLVSALPVKRRPKFGSAKELVTISDDFDEPLEDFKDYMFSSSRSI
jgi:antitoxin (DNA-binding transcriptional repressor) of toxin-antitoxin stability system